MNTLWTKAIISGIFFGVWPLLMNRSGLSGNVASLTYTFMVLVCVLLYSLTQPFEISSAHWVYAIGAGILGTVGLLFFNDIIAKAVPQNLGLLIVLMLIAQTVPPAIYQIIQSGISFQKALGFLFAIVSIVLLMTKDRF